MPFNGDYYTNTKDLAPSHDFYQQNLMNKGVLPGSWQMRNAYAEGRTALGSDVRSPGFETSYARDINTGGRAPGNAYQARSVSGTMGAPQGGTAYGPGSEETTMTNFFGKMNKLKDRKTKESTGKTPKGGPGPDDTGGTGMGSQQSGNTSNSSNKTRARNMSQSANVNQSGNQIISGGDTTIDGDFAQAQIGAGATALSRGASLQHFMFDPNHPFFNGGPGPKPPTGGPDLPPPQSPTPQPPTNPPGGPTPQPPKGEWSPEDRGVMDMGIPRPGQPGSNTGGMPPQYEGMGGDYVAGGVKYDGNGEKGAKPAPTPPSKPGGSFLGAPRGGGGPSSVMPSNPGPTPEARQNGSFLGAPRTVGNVPSPVFPGSQGPTSKELVPYQGGPPATTTPGGAPTGAPTGGAPTTGLPPKQPGFLGRLWSRAADRVMRGTTYGPGPEYVSQETSNWMADNRGLPSGGPAGELPSGAPFGLLPAGPQLTGYNRAAQSQAQNMGINLQAGTNYGLSPSGVANMTRGNSANNGSPASTAISAGGATGAYGGRGPARPTAKVGRYGETPTQPSSPMVNPNNPNNLDMYSLTAQKGIAAAGGYNPAASGLPQPSRHDFNPETGALRPDFGNPSYTGPSRHPRPPARDMTQGQTGYAGVAMQAIGTADSELKRQAFRQRSRRPGT
jgi:hypothetical protein